MRIRFLRHSVSEGCKNLCEMLREGGYDAKLLKLSNSRYRGTSTDLVINWGSSDTGNITEGVPFFLNQPHAVARASNKATTFQFMEEYNMQMYMPTVAYDKGRAKFLMERDCLTMYCRTLNRASQGRGIIIAERPSQLVEAPLYTSKLSIDRELRIHVFEGEVIDYAQKKRVGSARREEEGIEVNEDVRNVSNGWVFAREGVEIPERAKEVCIRVLSILGLSFGAVDLVMSVQGVPKVLEVNTAPGLEGSTLQSYYNAVIAHVVNYNQAL